MPTLRSLPLWLALCGGLVACQSDAEPTEEAPPALAHALGGVDLGPRHATPDDPRELLAYDYEPFVQAGYGDAAGTLRGLVHELLQARAATTLERPGEVSVVGHLLAIRALPQSLEIAQSFLRRLQREKTAPLTFDVHLVSVPQALLGELGATQPGAVAPAFLAKLHAGLESGEARSLLRRALRLTPGKRASVRESSSRRPVTKIAVQGGLPVTEQETVEDGVALHTTCWLAAGGYAMAHLELAMQREAPASEARTLAASYHVPEQGKRPAAKVEAAIDLPRVRSIGFRAQVQLPRGRWQAVAAGPSVEPGQSVIALVRASWSQEVEGPLHVATGHELRSLRVALLQRGRAREEEQAAKQSAYFGASMLGGSTKQILKGLESEWQRQASVSVLNDVSMGFGRQISALQGERPFFTGERLNGQALPFAQPQGAGWTPLLPERLQKQSEAFERVRWGSSTRLYLAWDQLHVIQSPGAQQELQALVRGVEAWRNRPLRLRAEWLALTPAQADALQDASVLEGQLAQLRAQRLSAPYTLDARSGAWTELSLFENEGVLWGFLGDDRPSPEIRFVPRGSRLSLRPRRYGDGRLELKVRFAHDEAPATSMKPVARAEGLIHKPKTRTSSLEQVLTLRPGKPQLVLAGANPDGRGVRALVLTCWE